MNLTLDAKYLEEFEQLMNASNMSDINRVNCSLLNGTDTNFSGDVYPEGWKEAYKPVLDGLMIAVLVVIMLSMGCEITWRTLYAHLRNPVGLCIGMLSQFGVMPLSAFSLLVATGIEGLHATGVLIISCCPGGVLSNTFTYFCDGDLSLSVAMTCASTIAAMGMMPLNIWLYGRRFESEDLVIPYEKMAYSLISVTSPVVVGMLVKWKSPRIAKWMTKLGSYCGLLITIICIAMELTLFPNMFTGVSLKVYSVILTLPLIGISLGYGLAYALKRNMSVRKTICIECGVQNVPVALTIIAMSFPLELQEDIVLLPLLYAFAMMSGCSVICFIYHYYKRRSEKNDGKQLGDNTYNKDTSAEEAECEGFIPSNGVKIQLKPPISNGKCNESSAV